MVFGTFLLFTCSMKVRVSSVFGFFGVSVRVCSVWWWVEILFKFMRYRCANKVCVVILLGSVVRIFCSVSSVVVLFVLNSARVLFMLFIRCEGYCSLVYCVRWK